MVKVKETSSLDLLKDVMDKINKSYGSGTVYEYKNFKGEDKERVPTGSLGLDYITGGGWVKGLMHYISGFESSGKSTICLYAIAKVQQAGGRAAYIDHEYCFDKAYAESLGVNVDELIVSQPDTIEKGYQILVDLVSTGLIDIIIFDSIAAAQTQKEADGDVGDQSMGVKAKLNSTTFPKITQTLHKHNTIGIFVNQLREKIGVVYGSPITEPGGNAVKFYPSIKIELRQSEKQKDGDGMITGNLVKAKCTKNKTARPFLETDFIINYGEGISKGMEILSFAEDLGLVKRSGSWYSYGDIKLGQGANNVVLLLKDNVELTNELESEIRKQLFV